MSFIHLISIRFRFYIVLIAVSFSLIVLGVWGWLTSDQVGKATSNLFVQVNESSANIGALRESLSRLRRWESAAVAVGDSNNDQVTKLISEWHKELALVHDLVEPVRAASKDNPDVLRALDAQAHDLQAYVALIDPVLSQLQAGVLDGLSAVAMSGKADPMFLRVEDSTRRVVEALRKQDAASIEAMTARASAASILRLALVAGTLLIFIPLMWLILRSVCQPLDRVVAIANRIASGDLCQSIAVNGRDETSQLLQAIATMQGALGGVVGQVREAAEAIRMASAEVASGNLDLSNRTEQTASDLQRSAALIRSLTESVQHSTQSAQGASELVASSTSVAAQGGAVMERVVETMQEINQSSRKISNIISVIDNIAFQTNILALNAAVEAARAGEQGRGFAVVASEVRNLATRSAQAAREVKLLIDDSVRSVDAGSQLVVSAGQTMKNIVESVERVTAAISEIRRTAAQQNEGMGHINYTLGELDQMTQQNAALVEQSAAAAESLRGHAEKLTEVVGTFRLNEFESVNIASIDNQGKRNLLDETKFLTHSKNIDF